MRFEEVQSETSLSVVPRCLHFTSSRHHDRLERGENPTWPSEWWTRRSIFEKCHTQRARGAHVVATFDQARVVYFVGRGELPRRAGGGSGASERRPVKRRGPKMSFLALAAPGVNPSRVAPRSRFSSRVQGRTGSSPWPSCATARARHMAPLCGTMRTVRRPFRSALAPPQTTTFRPNPFFLQPR